MKEITRAFPAGRVPERPWITMSLCVAPAGILEKEGRFAIGEAAQVMGAPSVPKHALSQIE